MTTDPRTARLIELATELAAITLDLGHSIHIDATYTTSDDLPYAMVNVTLFDHLAPGVESSDLEWHRCAEDNNCGKMKIDGMNLRSIVSDATAAALTVGGAS